MDRGDGDQLSPGIWGPVIQQDVEVSHWKCCQHNSGMVFNIDGQNLYRYLLSVVKLLIFSSPELIAQMCSLIGTVSQVSDVAHGPLFVSFYLSLYSFKMLALSDPASLRIHRHIRRFVCFARTGHCCGQPIAHWAFVTGQNSKHR